MPEKANVFVGTSGWSYRHWRGPFYPIDESNTELLDFYARRFKTANAAAQAELGIADRQLWRDK